MAEEKEAKLEGKIEALENQILTLEDEKGASSEEVESLKEEMKALTDELEVYKGEGRTVEEAYEAKLKKKDEEIAARDEEIKKRDGTIKSKDKEAAKAKVLSDFPMVDPSWILGETEEEMRKSAELAKTKLDDIINKKLEESGMKGGKWDKTPAPGAGGAGGGGPVAADDAEAVKKELTEEIAKGTKGDAGKLYELKMKLGSIQLGLK